MTFLVDLLLQECNLKQLGVLRLPLVGILFSVTLSNRSSSSNRARAEIVRSDLEWYHTRGDMDSALHECSRMFSRSLLLLERALPCRLLSHSFNIFQIFRFKTTGPALRKLINSDPG